MNNDLNKQTESIKNLREKLEENQNEIQKLNLSIAKNQKKEFDELKKQTVYGALLEKMKKEKEALTTSLKDYEDIYEKKLAIDKWYNEEYKKIQSKKTDQLEKTTLFKDLDELYTKRLEETNAEIWQERGAKIGDIFGNELTDVLTEFGNFDGNMRNMIKNLYNYLIEESSKALLQQVFGIKQMKSILNALDTGSQKGRFIGAASNIIKGIGKSFGIFHSGGIVPVGANAELPGTDEQLALLKGGERILSPSENTSYNSSGSGSTPIVFNNFNVKAWDSKDVQKYLLENKSLINKITFDGIKSNDSDLRFMVRNA